MCSSTPLGMSLRMLPALRHGTGTEQRRLAAGPQRTGCILPSGTGEGAPSGGCISLGRHGSRQHRISPGRPDDDNRSPMSHRSQTITTRLASHHATAPPPSRRRHSCLAVRRLRLVLDALCALAGPNSPSPLARSRALRPRARGCAGLQPYRGEGLCVVWYRW
nr:unnamed protein product [Digitaria exilis]